MAASDQHAATRTWLLPLLHASAPRAGAGALLPPGERKQQRSCAALAMRSSGPLQRQLRSTGASAPSCSQAPAARCAAAPAAVATSKRRAFGYSSSSSGQAKRRLSCCEATRLLARARGRTTLVVDGYARARQARGSALLLAAASKPRTAPEAQVAAAAPPRQLARQSLRGAGRLRRGPRAMSAGPAPGGTQQQRLTRPSACSSAQQEHGTRPQPLPCQCGTPESWHAA